MRFLFLSTTKYPDIHRWQLCDHRWQFWTDGTTLLLGDPSRRINHISPKSERGNVFIIHHVAKIQFLPRLCRALLAIDINENYDILHSDRPWNYLSFGIWYVKTCWKLRPGEPCKIRSKNTFFATFFFCSWRCLHSVARGNGR